MQTSTYKKKRDFKKTPEPEPGKTPISTSTHQHISTSKGHQHITTSLSFVVQRHDASRLHYDFRLEMEGVLKSWAVPKGPSMVAGEKRLAVMVEDHPLEYGRFYGEIPQGNYGAGIVEIWDKGKYKPLNAKDDAEKVLTEQLQKGDLKIVLSGTHLKGVFALVRIDDGEEKNWLLIKKKDEFAERSFNIETLQPVKSKQLPKSRKTGKGVAKEPFPSDAPKPMLARLSGKVIDREDWIYEPKYDGYRLIAKINKGRVEMLTRNGHDITKVYTPIADDLRLIEESVILDGEMVVEDSKGISDFQALQNYSTLRKGSLKYYVFDILYLNGYSVIHLSLKERKELLESFFANYNFKHIFNSYYQIGNGKELYEKLTAKGYEGVIAKAPESSYLPGRRLDTWLKIKGTAMQEAVIGGYTLPLNSRKYFGSLILGLYDGNVLKYTGNCGTGFTEVSLKELYNEMEKLGTVKCPFNPSPKLTVTKGKPVWIKAELVCKVKFLEWTPDGLMRQPVFMGLRTDKDASEVVNESESGMIQTEAGDAKTINVSGRKVKCTHLNKVYWPEEGYTKGDLIGYYQSISKYILPYLKNRPQSLNRHPHGITGSSFYHKDMDVKQLPEWIKTEKLYSKSNEGNINFLICNDAAKLVYMVNLGCIELNPWHSTFLKPEEPTYMMLDLDPGNNPFRDVIRTALVIKEVCDEIEVPCYCKTSGATGLHIYFPLSEKYSYEEARTFAEILAIIVHNRLPEITSIERPVTKRSDKVYIDFLQNRKGQTIAAPYSVRPRPGATVSTPLLWEEVDDQLTPQMFTIKNVPQRLADIGDLWSPVLKKGINLVKAIKAIEMMEK